MKKLNEIKFGDVVVVIAAIITALLIIIFDYLIACGHGKGAETLTTILIVVFNVFGAWSVPVLIRLGLWED